MTTWLPRWFALLLGLNAWGRPDSPVHLDRYGDTLPPHAVARLGTERFRQGNYVNLLAFSADGKTLTSCGADNIVRLWRASTGEEIRHFAAEPGSAFVAGFSPGGKVLALGSEDRTVRLWDVATGKPLGRLTVEAGFKCLAFSPDGRSLALAYNTTIQIRDAATGKELCRVHYPNQNVVCVAFSHDGKLLAAGGTSTTVHLWDVPGGKELHWLRGHTDTVAAVAFSPGSQVLASAGHDRTIRLWDVATGKERRRLSGHEDAVGCLAFAPGGETLASGSADRTVRLWDVAAGKELHRLEGHRDYLCSLAFAPDGGAVASGSVDSTIRLWDVATGKQLVPLIGHEGPVFRTAFSPDTKALTSYGGDQTIRVWDIAAGRELRRWDRPFVEAGSDALSSDGKLLATAVEGQAIRIWDVATGKVLGRSPANAARGTGLTFSPGGKLLALWGFPDPGRRKSPPELLLWDVAAGTERRRLPVATGNVQRVVFSPDSKVLAAVTRPNGEIRLWDVASGKELYRLQRPQTGIDSITFSGDGRFLASVGGPPMVCLWDAVTGKELPPLALWEDPPSGIPPWEPQPQPPRLFRIAFSPDSKSLAFVKYFNPVVHVVEMATGQERLRLNGHRGDVLSLNYSPDSKTLATGSADATVLVWDVTGRPSGRRRGGALTTEERDALWSDLAAAEARRAFRAIGALAASPDRTVPFLKRHFQSVPSLGQMIAGLVAALDDDDFPVREKAHRELEKLGPAAEPALRRVLEGRPSPEVRGRVERLLEQQNPSRWPLLLPPAALRTLRAVEALEQIGTLEARAVLEAIQRRMPEDRLGLEAQAALQRLTNRLP